MHEESDGWKCNKLGAALAAEIVGIDLSQPLDDAQFSQVVDLFHENLVMVFRDQKLTPAQHVAFSRRLGDLELPVQKAYRLPGQPEIYCISNCVDENGKPLGLADAGKVWHTDLSYLKEVSRCSLLHGLEIPHDDNGVPLGNTQFINMALAYEMLPAATKKKISGRTAVHSYQKIYDGIQARKRVGAANLLPLTEEEKKGLPPVEHPVVATHPYTGKEILFVNEGTTRYIVGLDPEEGDALLRELLQHLQNPAFKYTHRWRVGDLLMWDNLATQHFAVHDYELPLRRRMQRTTVKGTAPVFRDTTAAN